MNMASKPSSPASIKGRQRFQLLSVEELLAKPPIQWRCKDLLPQTGTAAIFGPSGAGKSFLALDLAMALSDGQDWFGIPATACPVIYCALEGETGMVNRTRAYREKHPDRGNQLRFITDPINIRDQDGVNALAEAILADGAGGGVVIIDTLNRATPGADENASSDMGEIISNVSQLQTIIGGLAILIHHTGKDEAKGLRGHSSLLAALDVAIEVKRIGKSDKRTWQVFKSKDGSEGNLHPFTLEVVSIGADSDGEAMTSCVVQPTQSKDITIPPRQRPIPAAKNQRTVFMALQEELSKPREEHEAPPPIFVPDKRTAIRYEEAVQLTKDRLDCEKKRKAERAKAAIKALVKSGHLEEQDGWLWLP